MKIHLNDITDNNEKIELDLTNFFWVWEFQLDNLDWINIDNFTRYLKKNLIIKKQPIIKINPNKINVETIKINNNLKKDIDLLWEKPLKDKFTLDYKSLEKVRNLRKKHFDIFIKRDYNWKFFKKKFVNFYKKIDNFIFKVPKKVYVWVLIFSIFLVVILSYAFGLKFLIKDWYSKMAHLLENSKSSNDFEKNVKKIKLDFNLASILYLPLSVFKQDENSLEINNDSFSKKITNAWNLINAGQKFSNIMQDWIILKDKVLKFIEKKEINNVYFTNLLENISFKKYLANLSSSLWDILISLYKIDNLWDSSLDEKFFKARKKVFLTKKKIDLIYKDYDILLDLLWHKKQKKYLVLFQNSDELRPTWWFPWSVWVLTIFRWKVQKFEKKDIYYYKFEADRITKYKELAPRWLDKMTKYFWLGDANYFVDVGRSSRKIKYFMKKAWENIDWVIYINQNIVLDFLDLVDWVKFKEIWQYITSQNFSVVISSLVEAKKFKKWVEWTPKKILFVFMEDFYKKLQEKKEYGKYIKTFLRNLKTRDIMIYSFENNKILRDFWIDWYINFKETLDFNYPIFTSIWWNKSDRYITRTYKKNYLVDKNNCDITTRIEIDLKNNFDKKEKQKIIDYFNLFKIVKNRENLLNIQWAWINYSYVRVLLPKKAILDNTIAHKEILFKDRDYKIVDFYMKTKPWQKSSHFIDYTLKNPLCKKYSYKLYKQPWIREYNLDFEKEKKVLYEDWEYKEK